MSQWLESLSALIVKGNSSVLITVVEAKGSVPRGAGTKMIVTDKGIHHGTIGGGNLEYQCIGMAQQRLLSHRNIDANYFEKEVLEGSVDWLRKVQRFPLGASLGQCCGGLVIALFEYIEAIEHEWLSDLLEHKAASVKAELVTSLVDPHESKRVAICQVLEGQASPSKQDANYLVELIEPNDFNIVVFGAGHVGRALVHVLSGVECEVIWVDSRANEFPEKIPANVTKIVEQNPEDIVGTAPAESYFIVLTHSHSLDQLLCETILKRGDFRLCGLIGSQSKRMKFEHRLQAKGYSEQQIARLTCPIGIQSLNGKQPGHIAIAVAAQLLLLNEAEATH